MAIPGRMHHRLLQLLMLEEVEDRDAMLAAVALNRLQERQRRPRLHWVKPWLTRRPLFGQYETLFQELDQESAGDYFGFIRMDRNLHYDAHVTCIVPTPNALQKYDKRTFLSTRTSRASWTYDTRTIHLLGKYVFVVKHPGFFSYFPCVTRTPSLLTQYVCRACFRRAPCVLKDADLSQRKTGRPVLWLRAVRRLCVHQKTYVARTCIVLLCQILHVDRTQTTRTPNVRVALIICRSLGALNINHDFKQ